jgi:hypothetical protein
VSSPNITATNASGGFGVWVMTRISLIVVMGGGGGLLKFPHHTRNHEADQAFEGG